MHSQSIGSVEMGEIFYFAISNRDTDGTAINGFTPAYYDVIDDSDSTLILANQSLTKVTNKQLWRGAIDTRDTSTDASGPFEPGCTYSIVVKTDSTLDPPVFLHWNFTVTPAYGSKLQRILCLEGENVLLDLFVYDNGNNATSFRVRCFDTSANAAAATPGLTSTALPETGEISTYTVTQTFSAGRNLRQTHLSRITDDKGDL